MSIEILFHPEAASKAALRKFVMDEGFVASKYFLNAKPKGAMSFFWFCPDPYRSIEGVEAVIYSHSETGQAPTWMLHLRTRAGASSFDLEKQNNVVRKARKLFGGWFDNDHGGKNIYIKISREQYVTPEEIGLCLTYDRVKRQIYQLKGAIDQYQEDSRFDLAPGTHKEIVAMVLAQRPSLTLFNSLLPFLVAVLEHFLSEVFVIMIELDPQIRDKVKAYKLRDIKDFTTVDDLLLIQHGSESIERKIAMGINFQNLEVATKQYKEFLGIDLKAVLKVKRKLYRKVGRIYDQLEEMILRRHGVVHRFEFKDDVDKEKFIYFLFVTNSAVDLIASKIESAKNFDIIKRSEFNGLDL